MGRLHRTTVDIDVEVFERARAALGTRGYRDTIDLALREVDRRDALRRAATLIRGGGLRELNIVRPEDLPKLRRVER
jgi:Arc/MetJ family transcription regulator